jgi:hypothetical protein
MAHLFLSRAVDSYFAPSIDRWLIDSYFGLSILILGRHEPDGPSNGTFLQVQNAPEDVEPCTARIGAKDLAPASGLEEMRGRIAKAFAET